MPCLCLNQIQNEDFELSRPRPTPLGRPQLTLIVNSVGARFVEALPSATTVRTTLRTSYELILIATALVALAFV